MVSSVTLPNRRHLWVYTAKSISTKSPFFQYSMVTSVVNLKQCLQIVTLCAQRPVCLCLSQWNATRVARETRYVLRAMLRDHSGGTGVGGGLRAVRGQGSPVTLAPWMGWRRCGGVGGVGMQNWGWTQIRFCLSLPLSLINKVMRRCYICVCVFCFPHPGLALSQKGLLLWRDRRQEADIEE